MLSPIYGRNIRSGAQKEKGTIPVTNFHLFYFHHPPPTLNLHEMYFKEHSCSPRIDQKTLYTFRKQRGVNLGSLFTLETWLTPSLFKDVQGAKSEIDLCNCIDGNIVRQRLEQHWNTFINQGDWQWMKGNGINTVRLPISYYHFLPGHPDASVRELMAETEYERFTSIYQNAYQSIINIIQAAGSYGIGVLIDLHGAPGGQNGEGHCGLSTGKANFFEKRRFRKQTIAILLAIAATITQYDNVIGLELINEPKNHHKLPGWYTDAIDEICKKYGNRLPLYLCDCWSVEQYAQLLAQNRHLGFLIMDHHLYRCFTPNDHSKSAKQHAEEIHPSNNGPSFDLLTKASEKLQGDFVIGEWSAALHHTSLQGLPNHIDGNRQWAFAQLEAFHQKCGGFYFWTLKKEGPTDVGWCLYSAIEQGVLPCGLGAPHPAKQVDQLQSLGEAEAMKSYNGHVNYWNAHANGKPMNHDKFKAGFQQIWSDCLEFYQFDASQIGFSGRWIEQRAKSHSKQFGNEGEWEFVHGAKQACQAFNHIIHS